MNILQINTRDIGGGAEKVAFELFRSYRRRGHGSFLAVGFKRSSELNVVEMPHHKSSNTWSNFWWRVRKKTQPFYGNVVGARNLCRIAHGLASPAGYFDRRRGIEDFHYPGSRQLLDVVPKEMDIVHAHNLHGGYFDLREIQHISQNVPTVVTLHDAWLLAGHCAHSLSCDRWKSGCGQCPDLSLYPKVRKDATARNWTTKRDIFRQSKLYVATPCRWLMERVEQSMLAPAVVDACVIPYGVDLDVYKPANKVAARQRLNLDQRSKTLLFAANGIRKNSWKDFDTMRAAFATVAERMPDEHVTFLALGEEAKPERMGRAEIRFIAPQSNTWIVSSYLQAADVYIHAAKADTFPNAILEALACGTPVVATAVGGIPEQLNSWTASSSKSSMTAGQGPLPNGILVQPGNYVAMAEGILRLLKDDKLRLRLGENAAEDARQRFDLHRQVDDYLNWFDVITRETVHRHQPARSTDRALATTP